MNSLIMTTGSIIAKNIIHNLSGERQIEVVGPAMTETRQEQWRGNVCNRHTRHNYPSAQIASKTENNPVRLVRSTCEMVQCFVVAPLG
jgi:hypothetical protein